MGGIAKRQQLIGLVAVCVVAIAVIAFALSRSTSPIVTGSQASTTSNPQGTTSQDPFNRPTASTLSSGAATEDQDSPSTSVEPQPVAMTAGYASSVADSGATIEAGSRCTHYVSPDGDDAQDGSLLSSAWRTADTAAERSNAGDVICFSEATYPSLAIVGKSGMQTAPITFRALDVNRPPTFAIGDYESLGARGAIKVEGSKNIALVNLKARKSMKGITVKTSSNVLIAGCNVADMGQEAIHVSDGSEAITIAGCDVSDTGKRKGGNEFRDFSVFGELIYIGQGSGFSETTSNVLITNNVLHDNGQATSEAINTKPNASNVTIQYNHIYNMDTWCEAAISAQGTANVTIAHNVIHDITASGFGDNNYQCRQAIGIRLKDLTGAAVFANTVWNAAENGFRTENVTNVELKDNVSFGNGRGYQLDQNTSTSGNLSSDESGDLLVSAADFIGPLTGTADAGEGPGSGFEVR